MDAISAAQALVCLFFAACFLQSGTDKVSDWKGNLEWLTGHFAKTPFRGLVPALLGTVTVMELATGLVCVVAAVFTFTSPSSFLPSIAMGLACLTLLMLFTGQRIAKDYVGAATLATYFGVALLGLFVTGYSRTG